MATAPLVTIQPLTPEEEDELLATRLTNDERMLRRLARRFNHLSILARKLPPPPPVDPSSNARSATEAASKEVQDAREAFLADLDLFQTTLIKNRQICQAEGRMVDHYEKEKQRVAGEHEDLIEHINKLKLELEEAQITRRRRMEYDEIAVQINAFSSRSELEGMILRHEEEVLLARTERRKLEEELVARKAEFHSVIASLQGMRARGFGNDESRLLETAEAGEIENDTVGSAGAHILNPSAKPFQPSTTALSLLGVPSRTSTPVGGQPSSQSSNNPPGSNLRPPVPRSGASSPRPSTPLNHLHDASAAGDDDIEMGEVAEGPKDVSPGKGKRTPKEDLEEGEASDQSSDLSELPEEYQ